MTTRTPKPKPAKPKGDPATTINVTEDPNKTPREQVAEALLEYDIRHGIVAGAFAYRMLGKDAERPGLNDSANFVEKRGKAAACGNLDFASHTLASQALSLDAMFTEFARIASMNIGYIQAAETFARLAMKAQAQSRATLEALAKLHQPREQIVKHVHVNEGGQALVADHFHAGGSENAKTIKQSQAAGSAGACAALPSPDPFGKGMPIPGGQGPEAVPHARRNESRRA